uniref:DNA-directed RNA polymerase subunit n=1 Tax=Arion vulgaris TaxID=1028688 RepID=A0A0B7A2Z9_9EUPU
MEPITSPAFSSDLQFCPVCGSILPVPGLEQGVVSCGRCPFQRYAKDYADIVEEFTIHFNSPKKKHKKKSDEETETVTNVVPEFNGPTVDRQCPRCHHDTMTYTTRQTRSADEGQTVFYSCVSCKFQDIEYS